MSARLLRDDLLAGTRVVADGPWAEACRSLGAEVVALAEHGDDEAAATAAAALGHVDTLVWDGARAFTAAGAGYAGLRSALDGAWLAVRAVAGAGWIGDDPPAGGKLVLLAPRPGDGEHAEAARAGLENLARTLSIEWARYGVRTAALTPGPRTDDGEVAQLVCFLASPAGDYFSGCRLDLR